MTIQIGEEEHIFNLLSRVVTFPTLLNFPSTCPLAFLLGVGSMAGNGRKGSNLGCGNLQSKRNKILCPVVHIDLRCYR